MDAKSQNMCLFFICVYSYWLVHTSWLGASFLSRPVYIVMNCVGYLLLLWGYKYMSNVLMLKRSPSSTPIKVYCYCML